MQHSSDPDTSAEQTIGSQHLSHAIQTTGKACPGDARSVEKRDKKSGTLRTRTAPFSHHPGGADGSRRARTRPARPTPATGHLIGYARTSRRNQNLDRQINALTEAGCQRIYRDQLSDKDAARPGLTKALDQLLEGDTLVVTELSRLGCSLQDLITIVTDLRRHNVGFRSLHEQLDTTTPGGPLTSVAVL
jgi:Resolvase, N terminal domain